MNVSLTLLLVTLGGEALQAIGYVGKVGLEGAFIGKFAFQLGLVVLLKSFIRLI